MHFSIPDTEELVDDSGNTYLGYNIHINGIFHCTVRYKQLHNLHEQLLKELDVPLPPFPPKKFFPLTTSQQEDRRLTLDKYIQAIGQNGNINSSELLNGFLLNAQIETANNSISNAVPQTKLECATRVYLIDDTEIDINIGLENSGQILTNVLKHLQLDEKYHQYFSLFIVSQDEENFCLLRKLQNFECPIISYSKFQKVGTKIIVGKWYWDIGFDNKLLEDSIASNLLFIQAKTEISRSWIVVSKKIQQQLSTLMKIEKKNEYLEIVRSLKYYGYVQFVPCICDYPEINSKVKVAIGKNELNVRVILNKKEEQELCFKVTRMRCWRITTLHEGTEKSEESLAYNLELSFEYLMAKDKLQWITISSEQAILMSICLQSMIDELLLKNIGGNKKREVSGKSWIYLTRNGQSQIVTGSSKNLQDNESNNTPSKVEPMIKKFSDRFMIGKSKKVNPLSSVMNNENKSGELMENNAFCMIGDDDL